MQQELDRRLSEARQDARRKDKLEANLGRVRAELTLADEKRQQLRTTLEKEGADVKKLEGMSFTNLVVSLFGDKEHKLSEEKKELAQAQLRYDEHLTEVNALRSDIAQIETELQSLAPDVDARYRELMREKEQALLGGAGDAARQLAGLADQIADASSEGTEIGEALQAGKGALTAMGRVAKELESASNWGVVDMVGGGLLTTMIKHGKLDAAKKAAADAGHHLKRFGRELQDVQGRTSGIEIDIGTFATFADYFLDGLLFDWVVQSKISKAQKGVEQKIAQVRGILQDLHARGVEAAQKLDELQQQRSAIINSS